jgi:hypothetical protein
MCKHGWKDLKSFIEDPEIILNGYLADFNEPGNGLIVVTHKKLNCGSTISIRAKLLKHLYTGPVYENHMTGKKGCPGKCLLLNDFSECSNKCNMRWVRDVMQLINDNHYPADSIVQNESFHNR